MSQGASPDNQDPSPDVHPSVGEMLSAWLHGSEDGWRVDTPNWMCVTVIGVDVSEDPVDDGDRAWNFFAPLDPRLPAHRLQVLVGEAKDALAIAAPNYAEQPCSKAAMLLIMVKHAGEWTMRGINPAMCPDGLSGLVESLAKQGMGLSGPVATEPSKYGAEHVEGQLKEALAAWEASEIAKASAPGAGAEARRPSL